MHNLLGKIYDLCNFLDQPKPTELVHNLKYATIMARIHYLRVPVPLPKFDDINSLANYYKKFYNTEKGKATPEKFINDYHKFVD